jgi:hypothetical protein
MRMQLDETRKQVNYLLEIHLRDLEERLGKLSSSSAMRHMIASYNV